MSEKILKHKCRIIGLCGSLRKNSINSLILNEIERLSEDQFIFEKYNISRLPYFNPDLDNEKPPGEVADFRQKLKQVDGVIICTPEYVFSIPGVLKNALEWTVSSGEFNGKPTALITASLSGEKTHESLLLVLKTIMAKTGNGCELLIPGARGKFDNQGRLSDSAILMKLQKLISALYKTIHKQN